MVWAVRWDQCRTFAVCDATQNSLPAEDSEHNFNKAPPIEFEILETKTTRRHAMNIRWSNAGAVTMEVVNHRSTDKLGAAVFVRPRDYSRYKSSLPLRSDGHDRDLQRGYRTILC